MPSFRNKTARNAALAAINALEVKQIDAYRQYIADGTYAEKPEKLTEDIKKLVGKIKKVKAALADGSSKQVAANTVRMRDWEKLLALLEDEATDENRGWVNTALGRRAAAAAAASGSGGSSARGRGSTRKNGSSGRAASRTRSGSRSSAAANANLLNMLGASTAAPGGGGGGSTSSRGASGAAALAAHRERVLARAAQNGVSFANARKTLKAENNAARNAAKAAAAPAGKARGRPRSAPASRGAGGAAAGSATPSFNQALEAAYAQQGQAASAAAYNPFNDPLMFGPAAAAASSSSAAAAAAGAPARKRPETNWNRELKAVGEEMRAAANALGIKRPSQAQVMAEAKRRRNARKGAGGAAAPNNTRKNKRNNGGGGGGGGGSGGAGGQNLTNLLGM